MFRKSYRRLLRWNDEFPFAKFSVAEDERPVLAVELPIADGLDADALGLALARILGIADRLLDESKDWLWIGGRMPDPGDRTSAQRGASSTATRRACPSSLEPMSRRAVAGRSLLAARRRDRPAGRRRPASAEVRAADARPDDRHATRATTSSRPSTASTSRSTWS